MPLMPLLILIFLGLLLVMAQACARLPHIDAQRIDTELTESGRENSTAAAQRECPWRHIYPQGRWQFVHAITAATPDGATHTLIGISDISSDQRSLHSVLMSLEGLVIFDGLYDGRLVVRRALPPFDAEGFAQGLVDDIRLIFLSPAAPARRIGTLPEGASACRFPAGGGGTLDLIAHPDDGGWELRLYDSRNRLRRTVKAFVPMAPPAASPAAPPAALADPEDDNQTFTVAPPAPHVKQSFPQRLELAAAGLLGYKLDLKLLQARQLPDQALVDTGPSPGR